MKYYVRRGTDLRGPCTTDEINAFVAEGVLNNHWDATPEIGRRREQVERSSQDDWVALGEIDGIHGVTSRLDEPMKAEIRALQGKKNRAQTISLFCFGGAACAIIGCGMILQQFSGPGEANGFAGAAVLESMLLVSPILLLAIAVGTWKLINASNYRDQIRKIRIAARGEQ